MATKNEGNGFDPVAEGSHVARLYQIIYLGTIEGYQGKPQEKARLSFELPNLTKEFVEGEGEKPFSISKDYTLSTGELANLRKVIEGLLGHSLTDEEARGFDIEQLLGKAGIITVKHRDKPTGEGKYAAIDGVSPLVQGTDAPEQVNPSNSISMEDWTEETLASLPDFISDKIRSSQEYQFMENSQDAREEEAHDPDSIPF